MKRWIVGFTLAAGLGCGVAAGEGARIETYTLGNGLDVVLAPDARVPKVVMNVRYSVGSMNEPAGRSGFAHLFEHLMFSGTTAWPDVFAAHSAVGNTINAWTMEDGTVYYVEGLSANLPMMLSLEADRMANLGGEVDQGELDLQRSVVKNEMRQNTLDQAGGSGWEAFWSGIYAKPHPYSRTVIGSIADLDAATLDDVRGFFDTYYVPGNAVLVLTGDFAVADAKTLIAQTFGRIPPYPEPPRASAGEGKPGVVRLEMQDRVPGPIVIMGYPGPTIESAENGALLIAAELLGNSEIGALRSRLVTKKQVATSAAAYWVPGLLGGRFEVEASAAEGVDARTLEAELQAAVTEFVTSPVAPADVDRARRNLLLADRLGTESLKDRADTLGWQADMFGRITFGLGDDPAVADASVADVERVLRSVVRDAAKSVLVLSPGPRGGYPAVLTDSSGVPVPFTAKPRIPVDIPKLDVRAPTAASLPVRETATLSNGIGIVHYRMPEAPMAYVAATAGGGWSNAPQGKEGLIAMAAGMAFRGAGGRSYDAFARAAKDIGASIGYDARSMATSLSLGVPAENLDRGVALLADAVLRPGFDAGEWRIWQGEIRDWLVSREADLPGVAERAALKVLFPQVPGGAGPDWSVPAAAAIRLEDARTAFDKLFRPATTTFYSVGPLPLANVAAELEKAFGGWRAAGPGLVADPERPAIFAGRKVLLVPEPGASQSALFVARPAPGIDEPGRHEAGAVARLLGGDFSSRLNSVIREEKGYSYGVDSYLLGGSRQGSGMVVATTVQRDTTGPALAEIFKGFEGMRDIPVRADELNRTTALYQQVLAGEAETASGLFASLLEAVGDRSTLEEDHAGRLAKTELKLGDVARQAVALASLDPMLVVVVGDPEVVLPQLKAIGLTDVEVVERGATVGPGQAELSERALSLDDAADAQEVPTEQMGLREGILPARIRQGRSTRSVHPCEPDRDGVLRCGAAAHRE